MRVSASAAIEPEKSASISASVGAKLLAAQTAVNWRGRAEREQLPRRLPPSPPARRNEDDE